MPQMPAMRIAATIHASPITFSYRLLIASPIGASAPSAPPSRSSENAHVKRSITHLTRKLVTFQSCEAAHWAIIGGTPSGSVIPTSTW